MKTGRLKYFTSRWKSRWKKELNRREHPIRVVVDACGGDAGVSINVDAAIAAVFESEHLEVILVGKQGEIEQCLHRRRFRPQEIRIVNAEETVGMDDQPLKAAKRQKTSIATGLELLKTGEADAFVSVGNTGAVVATAMLKLGKIPNIDRAPILAIFPTLAGDPVAVLDVGANVDCRPNYLLQFAVLGATYAELVMERKNPAVALLSIGEESAKGNAAVKTAHSLLAQHAPDLGINFIGNIEGRDILKGAADVLVVDGFVGNILLKYTESIFDFVNTLFKKGHRFSILSLIGGLFLYPALRRTLKDFNYAEYGGAPLLGVKGNVVIGHGASSVKAVKNAILLAQNMAIVNLPQALSSAAEKLGTLTNKEKSNEVGNTGDRLIRA